MGLKFSEKLLMKERSMDPLTSLLITIDDDTPIFDAVVLDSYNLMLNTTMRVELSRLEVESK